ncbi:MAG: hypothetical protein AB1634_12575 [Thermodesulfobacteriota bacterium]
MKTEHVRRLIGGLVGLGAVVLLATGTTAGVAWAAPKKAPEAAAKVKEPARQGGPVHLTAEVGQVPARPPLYDKDVQPLSMEQCAQCHIGVFTLLQQKGARHQLPCVFCHTAYHTYAPGKVEYADAIPKCGTCHGLPHGNDQVVQKCGSCHSNAHAPLVIPDVTGDQCQRCHSGPPQALKQYPSKHSQVACNDCHTSHGYIPKCTMCHSQEGGLPFHLLGVDDSVCLGCHPVHSPLQIKYSAETPQAYCAPCHKNESHARVLNEVRAANSKHNTEVTCAGCHDEHGKIPECFTCHEPHKQGQTIADCQRCHSNPHQPKNIAFPAEEPQINCAPCHGEVYNELQASRTRHTALTCAKCHPRHGEIPECQRCHGTPHGEAMLKQFGTCGACHGIAHNVQGRIKAK